MALFLEAGIFAWIALLVFVMGLFTVARTPHRALQRALVAAVFIISLGSVGESVGQRLVDKAVERELDPVVKVTLLSIGSREASSSSLIGGVMAILLVGVGAGVQAFRREE